MPDMGQKCLGRVFIRQKKHSSGEKRGKKALIRGLPDMAFRKFPTGSVVGRGFALSARDLAKLCVKTDDPSQEIVLEGVTFQEPKVEVNKTHLQPIPAIPISNLHPQLDSPLWPYSPRTMCDHQRTIR